MSIRHMLLLCALAGCNSEARHADAPAVPELPSYGKARPVDEARRDPLLVAFRDTLLGIAGRKDSAALFAHLAPTIRYSFGDSRGGLAGFFAAWKKSGSDKLWATLTDVLAHGGRMQDSASFMAPWTFQALPDSLDAFEYLVVRDSGVAVLAAPGSDRVMGTLSFDIVRVSTERGDSLWRGIRLPDGRTGYAAAEHVRSPVEYRIGLRRFGARWLIDFFVAGD
jgi:hypothetical protein